jgi:hypothetical protein
MHQHGGERALLHAVTTLAISRLVTFDGERWLTQACVELRTPVEGNARGRGLQRFFAARPLQRKGMAGSANGFGLRIEAFGRIGRRVLDVSLFLVTRRTAIRGHWTHLVSGRGVAFHAFDLFFLHVNAMTGDVAREAPGTVDVHAGAPLPVLRRSFLPARPRLFLVARLPFFFVRTGKECREHEYWDQHPRKH